MVLFENSILKLNYNPATDILEVEYPDLHDFLLPEIKHSITQMIEVIKNYDVKRLLLDSTKTLIAVSEAESREVAVFLAGALTKTRVLKVARVQSPSSTIEKTAQNNIRHIKAQSLSYQLQNFTSKADAVAWLREQA